jgi:hypothetical protein
MQENSNARRVVSVAAVIKAVNKIANQPRDHTAERDASRLAIIAEQLDNWGDDRIVTQAAEDLRAIAGRLRDMS